MTATAPSFSSALDPRQAGESTFPGTANTSRPCSSARDAVMSAPEPSGASMMTTPTASPEKILFRAGKWLAAGGSPGAYSETSAPFSATSS